MTVIGRKLSQSVSDQFSGLSGFHKHLARSIINKYNRAIKRELDCRHYFEDLSTVPTAEQIKHWDKEISEAEELHTNRPEAMDVTVMAPRIPKGQEKSSS